ncbi:blastula protease 10-like [Acanthaster planci]|uniref:Metalloendopeptidase n=1 Tax=Acanthaster planci TaxID=133434 RepID=A0A8B7ZQ23_ACAPL|nr:blastula protease 10-like [Acanthaster planci]
MGVPRGSVRQQLRCFLAIASVIAIIQVGFCAARPTTAPMKSSSDLTTARRLSKTPLTITTEPREETPSPGAVQSDMMLTADQLSEIRNLEADRARDEEPAEARGRQRMRRKAVPDVARLWPGGIVPYEISRSSMSDRSVIEGAIAHWEEKTCLDFRPFNRRLARRLRHSSKIVFFKGSGCWSSVGRSHNGAQSISIGDGCAVLGSIVHEIGHAVGFFHEHSRPDRDDHIRVHTENIHPRYRYDFRELDWGRVTSMDVPYDTKSIMHYGSHYQSMNGEATITTIDPLQQANLGRRDGLSFGDAKLANIIYQCNAHCDLPAMDSRCLNEGYIGPSCDCVCPDDYSGWNCSLFTPKQSRCVELLTEEQGQVSSPNFPADYENDMHCIWYIKGTANSSIEMTFHSFAMEGGEGCSFDYFQYLNSDMSPLRQRHCGYRPPPTTEVLPVAEIVVEFQSDSDINASGFQFTYQLVPSHHDETF